MEKEVNVGRKERRRRHRFYHGLLAGRRQVYLLVLVGVSLIATAGVMLLKSEPVSGEAWKAEIVHAAQAAVRDVVREDLRTSFGGPEETHLEREGEGRYLVSGWVDLIAADGGMERQVYSCVMYKDQMDQWAHENLAVLPQ